VLAPTLPMTGPAPAIDPVDLAAAEGKLL